MTGWFVVVEGPNGVGKSTTARLLAARLRECGGAPVHLTAEPSDTPFGRLLRSAETNLTGRALALAIAADRYSHVESEIAPRLDAGTHVVCDRYVQSSLVLQRIDGLSLTEIWTYNAHALPPTISVYLTEDPDVIRHRLAARSRLSRLEVLGSPDRELALYDEARAYLDRRGWEQMTVEGRSEKPDQIVVRILNQLEKLT